VSALKRNVFTPENMSDQTLREAISDIQDAVVRIERALAGDPGVGQVGLVERVQTTEHEVRAIKQERRDEANQKRGALFVLTSIGALIGSIVTWILSNWKSS
jgi:hypothetical protein